MYVQGSATDHRRSVTSILGNFVFSRIGIGILENTLLLLRVQKIAHLHS